MMERIRKPLVILSCGGTGGHLQPGIALGDHLEKFYGADVLYLVNEKKISSQFLSRIQGKYMILPEIQALKIKGPGFFREIFKILIIFYKSLALALTRKVCLMVSAGNAAGIIPFFILKMKRVKTVLLEQNVLMGKANRALLPWADRVYLSFPCQNIRPDRKNKCMVTGNPISEEMRGGGFTREEAAKQLGLESGRLTLLFLGGSQGARRINEFALNFIPEFYKLNPLIQVIHLTGKELYSDSCELYRSLSIPCYCREFSSEMRILYSLTDFAISRAGGGALSELSFFNIPALLIPYPFAAENHQWYNASLAANEGGCWMTEESELLENGFQKRLMALLLSPSELSKLREKQKIFSKPESTGSIAEDLKQRVKVL